MPSKGYDFERQYITEISNKIERSIILYNVVVFKHGKTILTANLGVALGALGRNVTILDGDLAMGELGNDHGNA